MPDKLKCGFCGREVKETVHSKKLPQGYQVDYYQVWTGDLEPTIMKNPRDEREVLQFFKVSKMRRVIACSDCFPKNNVKNELDAAFKDVPEAQNVPDDGDEK
jgi:hypothetical protein